MPFKHQTESYRTRKGRRFVCFADIMDESLGDLREQATAMVNSFRAKGRAAFFEKQSGGAFYRIFVAA